MPLAPRAGTPTAETTKPRGTIAGLNVGMPASTMARVRPMKMTKAEKTNSGAIQAGMPLCHSQRVMPVVPTRSPNRALR